MEKRPAFFLSHSSADEQSVTAIARQLEKQGIPTWLSAWKLSPGDVWQDKLSQALRESSGCIVFLGPGGAAPWHTEEVRFALDRAVKDASYRLVPVLLPGARRERLSDLPGFLISRQWVEFRASLDEPDTLYRLACGCRGVAPVDDPALHPDVGLTTADNPYRGLRLFDVEHDKLFFGRGLLTQELVRKLGSGNRFVSIAGASGSGKSSLARAGLLASLRDGALPGSKDWPQLIIRPGVDPLESLATGVVSKLAPALDHAELIKRLRDREEALHLQVKVHLGARADRRVVLLVDQAEEAFSLGARDEDRAAFFANLVCAATVPTGQTVVVLAFRADFYPRFAEHRQLAALVSENQLLVPPMAPDELREVIERPARQSRRPMSEALVCQLVEDARGPHSLPLLEHALAQLWERPEPTLGLEQYHAMGELTGALNSRADAIFESLTAPQRAACRRLFLRLVQPGETALDTRRRVPDTELPPDQREVSQAFAAEGVHLLTWSGEGDRQFLEVVHEELIRRWKRLRRWVGEDLDGQRVHRKLTMAATEWNSRPPGSREAALYNERALEEVDQWLHHLSPGERCAFLNAAEQAFLKESRTVLDHQLKRVRELHAVALARQLTASVTGCLQRDPQLNLAFLKHAYWQVEREGRGTPLAHDTIEEVFQVLSRWASAGGRAELRGHGGPVLNASFSPDGEQLLTTSDDHTARLWDASTGRPLATLLGHSGSVRRGSFSPDGQRILTASHDGTARMWDAATGTPLFALAGHSGPVRSAAFSPDGRRAITTSSDRTARIWDAFTGKPLAILAGHAGPVRRGAFSPDGKLAVTAGDDHTARTWDAATGTPLLVITGHSGAVLNASFSPDGRWVLTASSDATARLWDALTGKLELPLADHAAPVSSAVFSPNGQRIITASGDKTARLWVANTGALLASLSGHSDAVTSATFSPDSRLALTTSDDNTARLWDAATGRLFAILSGHANWVQSAAFSPDGRRIVTASLDRTARLWDTCIGRPLATLSGHGHSVLGATFSPDGQRVLTASRDGTARISEPATGRSVAVLSGHSDWVLSASFSPDGRRVITGSGDRSARLWDAGNGKLLLALPGHSGPVRVAAFSPEGERALTASERTARLWDAATGRPLAIFSGHTDAVHGAAFSPDGRRVITASFDTTAQIWDADTGAILAVLAGHACPLLSAAFSPDGRRALTTSDDNTARLWNAATGEPLATLCGHAGPVQSAAFSPDGRMVLTGSLDKTARLWDAETGEALWELSGHAGPVWSAAFSPNGRLVLTASNDKTARLWCADTGKSLTTLSSHSDSVWIAAFSPCGRRVLTAGADGTALVWQDLLWAPRDEQLAVINSGRPLTPEERKKYLPAGTPLPVPSSGAR